MNRRLTPLDLLLAGLVLAGLMAGCAPSRPVGGSPPGPAIVLDPAPAAAHGTVRTALGAVSPAAVVRDTATLKDQATRYVARRDSNPVVIDRLTTLTLQARRAVQRMQAGRTVHGYRQQDVVAARAAADVLAAFLGAPQVAGPIAPAGEVPPTSEVPPASEVP